MSRGTRRQFSLTDPAATALEDALEDAGVFDVHADVLEMLERELRWAARSAAA